MQAVWLEMGIGLEEKKLDHLFRNFIHHNRLISFEYTDIFGISHSVRYVRVPLPGGFVSILFFFHLEE